MREYKASAFGLVVGYAREHWGMSITDLVGVYDAGNGVRAWSGLPANRQSFPDETHDELIVRVRDMWDDIFGYARSLGFTLADFLEGLIQNVLAPVNVVYAGAAHVTHDITMDGPSYWYPHKAVQFKCPLPVVDNDMVPGWSYRVELPADVDVHAVAPSNFTEVYSHTKGSTIKIVSDYIDISKPPLAKGFVVCVSGGPFEVRDFHTRDIVQARKVVLQIILDFKKSYSTGVKEPAKLCREGRKMWDTHTLGFEGASDYPSFVAHWGSCPKCSKCLHSKE